MTNLNHTLMPLKTWPNCLMVFGAVFVMMIAAMAGEIPREKLLMESGWNFYLA